MFQALTARLSAVVMPELGRLRQPRAMQMVEIALLAALAVGAIGAVAYFLIGEGGLIENLTGRIQNLFSGSSATPFD